MWITHKNKKGFTLIELLVVVAIIGILMTIASVSLVQARRRARDTKRVSDIQQVRNALVIYSNQRAEYPPSPLDSLTLGGVIAGCLDDSPTGFRATGNCGIGSELVIMQKVPSEATALPYPVYSYTRPSPQVYRITFRLEGAIGNLSGGDCIAEVNGISCTPIL